MAVYKRGYQRYQGPRTSRWARLLVCPRFAWRRMLGRRLMATMLVASLFWPLLCAGYIYLANHLDLLQNAAGVLPALKVDAKFFLVFMDVQAVFAVILAALAGPGLVAPDLSHNALPLYFSRPLSRADYVLGRLLVIAGLLSLVTWLPGTLLFAVQWGMNGWEWFTAGWRLGLGLVAGFCAWILLVSLVALACSAYARWRIVAGALTLGFFFVLGGAAGLLQSVFRADWSRMLNPALAMNQVWRALLGAELEPGPGPFACAAGLAVMALLLGLVLERKLRPVEVVR